MTPTTPSRSTPAYLFFVCFAFVVGCTPGEPASTTFYDDVAPLLDKHCMGCHTSTGIAPMSFETYEDTKMWAEAIVSATANRTMPPKQVVADGSCGDFKDPWWLADEEIAVFKDWVDADTPEGKEAPRAAPTPLPEITPTHTAHTPTFLPIAVGDDYAEFDEYRCFLTPLEHVDSDQFLTGYRVKPGNDQIVHHVIGHFVKLDKDSFMDGRSNAAQIDALSAESPDRDGWPCFSGPGEGIDYESDPIIWAPGQGATNFPDGLGVAVPAGSVLVTQVHYNLRDPSSVGQSDSTTIEMKMAPTVTKPMQVLYLDFLLYSGDTIPPGKPNYVYRNSITPNQLGIPIPINIVGMVPHMHERGVRQKVRILRDNAPNTCAMEVSNWDFNWQYLYFFDEPVQLNPTDSFDLSCTYDTSADTEPILAGWGTNNEMCLSIIYATL